MLIRWHPDGWVFVDDFMMSLAETLVVCPTFSVPEDTRDLRYELDADNNVVLSIRTDLRCDQRAGPERWASGDALATDWETKKASVITSRIPPEVDPPTPDPQIAICQEILSRWSTATAVEKDTVIADMAQRLYGVAI